MALRRGNSNTGLCPIFICKLPVLAAQGVARRNGEQGVEGSDLLSRRPAACGDLIFDGAGRGF